MFQHSLEKQKLLRHGFLLISTPLPFLLKFNENGDSKSFYATNVTNMGNIAIGIIWLGNADLNAL